MDALGSVDALGVILANTFRAKDMTEMRFSAEERACAEIERLHKKRKEFQSTSRMMAAWQFPELYENYDPIEQDLGQRELEEEFWKNPADHYQISTKTASAEVTERKSMPSKELHQFYRQKMTFRHRECDEEDMGVNDERRDGSTAAATKPMSLKTVISMSRSSTKSKGAFAQRKHAKRAIKHQGFTEDTAPTHEEHREGKAEAAHSDAFKDAVRLLQELREKDPDNTVAIERVKNLLHRVHAIVHENIEAL